MGLRNAKTISNSVLTLRRVTHFWLCLLETQVMSGVRLNSQPSFAILVLYFVLLDLDRLKGV